MSKPLTLQQQYQLIVLKERVRTAEQLATLAINAAKREVNHFMEYLADEHSAPPSDGWMLTDISVGFERPTVSSRAQAKGIAPPEGDNT